MAARTVTSRSFLALNATQFLGALNDNIFKLFIMFFLIDLLGRGSADRIVSTAGAVFVVPFLLFTHAAGVLADRFSKRTILVAAKVGEVGIMLLGLLMFSLHSMPGLYATLFLMSAQSALFGPSKYGIVPELVDRDRLSQANGLLVMLTNFAIILGSAAAPMIALGTHSAYALAQGVCVAVAVLGLLTSLGIERTPAAGVKARFTPLFVRDIGRTLWSLRTDRYLLGAVCASAYFYLIGAYMQLNIIPYGIQSLGLTQEQSGYLFFLAALGIAAGALIAGRLSGRNIEFGLVPLGALGLTAASVALNLIPSRLGAVCPTIFVAGVGAGLFIIPLEAFIQFRAPPERRGEILAANGFLSWVGVLIASGLVYLNAVLHLKAGDGFFIMGALTLVLTLVSVRVLPDFLLRFLALVITRCGYRIRVLGRENLPVEGGALLVCNHVSWADAVLLNATQQRRLRFLVYREIYNIRWLTPLLRLMGAIPIAGTDGPKRILAALHQARAELDRGYMVCIFAEGAITRTGMMMAFRSGFERIVEGSPHPVIPVYIGGAWGSIFSYYHGKPFSRWPQMLRYPVTVIYGKPLPATAPVADAREAVMELSCRYFEDRKAARRPLGETFVHTARENWRRRALTDTTGRRLTYGEALTGAVALADALEARTRGQERVGVLLPSSAGGALVNLAVTLRRRVPVNLNFTASESAFRSAIEQCNLRCIVSSREFLAKLGRFQDLPCVVFLEDLAKEITAGAKLRAFLKARFLPRAWLARSAGFQPDDLATILFSSGSTGTPKGVMLSHHNILSNVESMRSVFHFTPEDNLCAALPFFHSFGFTCALWMPLLSGISVSYHANPMDGAGIAALVRENRSTVLFATPTFLLVYLRKARAEDFVSLRYVIVGAEKLKPKVAEAFREQFDIRPLEGYGATELAPVATLSLPDVEIWGVRQTGSKAGSVGHPLPGVAVRIVDPETRQRVPPGTPGLMLIRGPNVMLGYWRQPEKTAEVLQDGWYNTGDIAVVDQDGFVRITDRLSRFSKIGGEMVPHQAVEEVFQQALGATGPVLAVSAVADEKKGERLVVLYTDEAGGADRLREIMKEANLPNLWKPAADAYFRIDALPVLGSGKLDLKGLKDVAGRLSGD